MTTGRLYLQKWTVGKQCRKANKYIICGKADENPPAHGFSLHARESKGTVPLHTDYPSAFIALAPLNCRCCDCETEAHSHRSKCTCVQPDRTSWTSEQWPYCMCLSQYDGFGYSDPLTWASLHSFSPVMWFTCNLGRIYILHHLISPSQPEETTTGLTNPNEGWVICLGSCVFLACLFWIKWDTCEVFDPSFGFTRFRSHN